VTPRLDFFGIAVSDMPRSVAFYRLLGLEFPEGAEEQPHVEAQLGGGVRFALDTEEVMRTFDPEWKRRRDTPQGAVGRLLGPALCPAEGSRRHGDRSVRAAPGVALRAGQDPEGLTLGSWQWPKGQTRMV